MTDTWECNDGQCPVTAVQKTVMANGAPEPLPLVPPAGWVLIEAGDASATAESWESRERRAFCPDHAPKVTLG